MDIYEKIKDIFNLETILYYPGCYTHFQAKELEKNYSLILSRLGIKTVKMPQFLCCGNIAHEAGYQNTAQEISNKLSEFLIENKITKIITNCPHCFVNFKKNYESENISVFHITQILNSKLSLLLRIQSGDVSYFDPCYLSKKSEIYNEPRNIIKQIGFNLIESDYSKQNSFCCGAGGLLNISNPNLSNEIAKKSLKSLKTKVIITSCPLCYLHLKKNSENKFKIYELSQVILNKIDD